MVNGIGVFKNYYDYDKTTATYLTNLLLVNPERLEEKLIEMASEGAVIFLHNDFITKRELANKIMEEEVPTVITIHEEDLAVLNSTKVAEKVIDIRVKTNEEGTEEFLGVV